MIVLPLMREFFCKSHPFYIKTWSANISGQGTSPLRFFCFFSLAEKRKSAYFWHTKGQSA